MLILRETQTFSPWQKVMIIDAFFERETKRMTDKGWQGNEACRSSHCDGLWGLRTVRRLPH